MPRFPTFPTLYDDCKTISIADLKRWHYLKDNQLRRGIMTWSLNGNKTGSINIEVNTRFEVPYLELDYQCNGKPINYKVNLITVPAHIRKGVVWFFICPQTGKRCRKLYLADTYFLHRSAFKGCMYEKQTYSYKNRVLFKKFDIAFGTDKLYEQLYKKYFKTSYAGKPTKRYSKLMQKIKESERIPYEQKELLYLA